MLLLACSTDDCLFVQADVCDSRGLATFVKQSVTPLPPDEAALIASYRPSGTGPAPPYSTSVSSHISKSPPPMPTMTYSPALRSSTQVRGLVTPSALPMSCLAAVHWQRVVICTPQICVPEGVLLKQTHEGACGGKCMSHNCWAL